MSSSEPPSQRSSTERIIAARLRLKARFEQQIQRSPGLADPQPQGSGPLNRHGMPRLPVGQHEAKGWPVLDLGVLPKVTRETFKLELEGACDHPQSLDWAALMALPQVQDVSDFHCVTSWSKFNMSWRGVRLREIAALAGVHEQATHIMCYGSDGYTTNVELAEALKEDVLLVHEYEGEPLAQAHGGPLRMITPQLYAWKGSKWICKIEFMLQNKRGFWEERGYSNSAHPWRNDRYS